MIMNVGVVHVPEGLDFMSPEWLVENMSKPVMPEGDLVVSFEQKVDRWVSAQGLGEAIYAVCVDALGKIRKECGLCAADLEIVATNTFRVYKIHCYGYRR